MPNDKAEIKVKSLKKTIDVLNCFTEKQPLGVTEISEKLGLYKSNVYDILTTLAAMDYLSKNDETGKYYLGIGVVRLGRAVGDRYSFQKVAAKHIQQISTQVGEVVYLTVPIKDQVYYLDAAFPTDSNSYLAGIIRSSTDGLYCTSCGKSMLAYMPEAFVDEYLKQPMPALTENTITDPEKMRDELKNIRLRGYATDNMENAIGLSCVAVPILAAHGLPQGAISISGPSLRFTAERIEEYTSILKAHVHEIERSI